MVKNAQQKLGEYAAKNLKGVNVTSKTISVGDPADEIISYIKNEGVDLVIMGTHGRRGVKRTFLGSVANEVITRSPVPVVVINPMRVE